MKNTFRLLPSFVIALVLTISPLISKAYFIVKNSYYQIDDCAWHVATVAEYDDETDLLIDVQVQFESTCGHCFVMKANVIDPEGSTKADNFNIAAENCDASPIELTLGEIDELWNERVSPMLE